MAPGETVLFKVILEKSRNELDPRFILDIAMKTKSCVEELLAVVGYAGAVRLKTGQSGEKWHYTVHVEHRLIAQLDLFGSQAQVPTVAQASRELIEATLVAIARFRREAAGIKAATLKETLKQLKLANPRVIEALACQPGGKITVQHEGAELELSVQSDSGRTVSAEPERLRGVIVAAGYTDLFVVPSNRRNLNHLCIHPVRVKIPEGLRKDVDPHRVLEQLAHSGRNVELTVHRERVVRKRQHVTYLLAKWPPTAPGSTPAQSPLI